jgi:hypothetical protein
LRRGYQFLDVGGKIRIAKIAFTFPEPGKIKSKNRDSVSSQRLADMGGGLYIFRTGKAMGKKGIGNGLGIIGQIDSGGKPLSGIIAEFELFEFHI